MGGVVELRGMGLITGSGYRAGCLYILCTLYSIVGIDWLPGMLVQAGYAPRDLGEFSDYFYPYTLDLYLSVSESTVRRRY